VHGCTRPVRPAPKIRWPREWCCTRHSHYTAKVYPSVRSTRHLSSLTSVHQRTTPSLHPFTSPSLMPASLPTLLYARFLIRFFTHATQSPFSLPTHAHSLHTASLFPYKLLHSCHTVSLLPSNSRSLMPHSLSSPFKLTLTHDSPAPLSLSNASGK